MIVKRRSAKFIGSHEWELKDVGAYQRGSVTRFIDKPTGIWVESGTLAPQTLFSALAHRVIQLS